MFFKRIINPFLLHLQAKIDKNHINKLNCKANVKKQFEEIDLLEYYLMMEMLSL